MRARFYGPCFKCNKMIRPGEIIDRPWKDSPYLHIACCNLVTKRVKNGLSVIEDNSHRCVTCGNQVVKTEMDSCESCLMYRV